MCAALICQASGEGDIAESLRHYSRSKNASLALFAIEPMARCPRHERRRARAARNHELSKAARFFRKRIGHERFGARMTPMLQKTLLLDRLPLAAVLFVIALALAQVQASMTYQLPLGQQAFERYLGMELHVIFHARLLMFVLIHGLAESSFRYISTYQANYLWQTLFLWGAFLALYAAARRRLGVAAALLAPLLAAAYIPWGFFVVGYRIAYPYDLPAIFFCASGLLAIVANRYWALAALIAIGTLNKETMAWLIPAYCFYQPRDARFARETLWRTAALAAIFGVAYETPRLWASMWEFGRPIWLAAQTSTEGPDGCAVSFAKLNALEFLRIERGTALQNIYWPLSLHLPAFLRFRHLPAEWRRLYWAAPFYLIPLFLWGNLVELRLFNEMIPLGAIGAAWILSRSYAGQSAAR